MIERLANLEGSGNGCTDAATARRFAREHPNSNGYIVIGVERGMKFEGFICGGRFYRINKGISWAVAAIDVLPIDDFSEAAQSTMLGRDRPD